MSAARVIPRRLTQSDIEEDCIAGFTTTAFVRLPPVFRSYIYTYSVDFAKQLLCDDLRYSAWANQSLLEGCSALTAQELDRDLRISHASILATLRHLYDGERIWLLCLTTTPDLGAWRLPTGSPPEPAFEAVRQNWPEVWDGYRCWLEDLPEASLEVELMIQFPGGVDRPLSRWKILRHVLDHSLMHRGQVVGMIRMLGHPPPAINRTDYYLAASPVGPPQNRN